MFGKTKEKPVEKPVDVFEFHIGLNGGCIAREPFSNGRLWVFNDLDNFFSWVKQNVKLNDTSYS